MRYLAVGDIHGCFKSLTTLAAFVPFQPDDTIITLGDYVDRGPDSRAVLNWLIARKQRESLIALRGNHELMMLDARRGGDPFHDWLRCGGDATLASYSPSGDFGRLADVPDSHWAFLENETVGWFEIENHFFVHANAMPDYSLSEQPDFMLYWEHTHDPPPHCSGKIMVCGHTPQTSGEPRFNGHAVCIDTCAYGNGWLTCLDPVAGYYWQANERGETRSDVLSNRRDTR